MIGFRAPPEITQALDKAVADSGHRGSRSEIIRSIVTDWLQKRGYLSAGPGYIRGGDLSSENDG